MASPSESLYARGFATDAETERALRAGLAGREAKIERGPLSAAIRTLASEPSSKLVFVDLDGIPEPETAARKLTAVCAFGTAVIAIGSTDTAHLTRALLRHGIADYLVKPISAAAVREASATALEDLPERMYAGRVIAFAGTAGSGASTLVATIARGVAAGGRTATVVDLNPASGSLSKLLDATPAGDLSALLATLDAGQSSPDESPGTDEALDADLTLSPGQLDSIRAPTGTAGVSLVACPPAGPLPGLPSSAAVAALLGHLANQAHVVLATGLFDPELRTSVLQNADAGVLLYEPTLASISAAVQCLARLGSEHATVLVQSHPRMRRSTLSQAQIRYALADRHPDVVIPFEPALHASATGDTQNRPLGKAYREALRQVIERSVESLVPVGS